MAVTNEKSAQKETPKLIVERGGTAKWGESALAEGQLPTPARELTSQALPEEQEKQCQMHGLQAIVYITVFPASAL